MNIAVIFAGGAGKRMNTRSVPKQFLKLHEKPVLVYTLEQFDSHPEIDAIVLVGLAAYMDYTRKLLARYQLTKVRALVAGGETGQASIFHGLTAAKGLSRSAEDIVLIHDGVRPLIDAATISACIAGVKRHGSAITTAPAIETIFVADGRNVGTILDRARCSLARAPQCFYLKDIYAAHLRAQKEKRMDFIDSAMLMQHYGLSLHTVKGPAENIKITTPMDFYLFRAILDAKENMQIVGL